MRRHSASYAVARCLSVRPSVTRRYCVKTAKHIIKLFSPSDRYTIRVSPHQTVWQYSDGDLPDGGVECRGGMKKRDFRLISRFILEMIQERAIITMERQ